MTGRHQLLDQMSEEELLRQILAYARQGGWLAYHTHDSRRSAEGFPDLVAVHPDQRRLIFAELKSATGRVASVQQEWIEALRGVLWNRGVATRVEGPAGAVAAAMGHALLATVWRPADLDAAFEILIGGRPFHGEIR